MLSLITSALLAATISSSTCSASVTTGCVTSYLGTSTALAVQVSGTWVGSLEFEGSVDGAAYVPLRGYPVAGGAYTASTTSNGAWTVLAGGLRYVRVRASAWTSGTATITQAATSASAVATVLDVEAVRGLVSVGGIVELGTETQAALAAPECRLPGAPPIITLTTTAQNVPAVALTGRTQLVVKNLHTSHAVWCCLGVGCTPTSSAAYVVLAGGDFLSLPVLEADTVRCRAATGTADVNIQESSCG